MKKSVLFIILLFAVGMTAQAQKFALIDMEYILKNIPAYERANEQLSQATKQWQGEVEVLAKEAQTMFKDYQAASAKLTAAQKTQKEDAIVEKEKAASELKRKYFGPEKRRVNEAYSRRNIQCGKSCSRGKRLCSSGRQSICFKHYFCHSPH